MPIVSFDGNSVISVQQCGPEGSGMSKSFPQSREDNGSDSTRKRHPRLDSRPHRRIVSAELPPLGAAETIVGTSSRARNHFKDPWSLRRTFFLAEGYSPSEVALRWPCWTTGSGSLRALPRSMSSSFREEGTVLSPYLRISVGSVIMIERITCHAKTRPRCSPSNF
jgi:hypothetical protein